MLAQDGGQRRGGIVRTGHRNDLGPRHRIAGALKQLVEEHAGSDVQPGQRRMQRQRRRRLRVARAAALRRGAVAIDGVDERLAWLRMGRVGGKQEQQGGAAARKEVVQAVAHGRSCRQHTPGRAGKGVSTKAWL